MGLEPKIIEELKQLKAGCDEIKGWLEKLEEKKSSVKVEVYQRVKSDYTNRLSELEKKASGLLPKLEAELANLRSKLSEVKSQKEELNTDLEELALRKELGELSEEEFGERSNDISKRIKNLEEEETSLTSSIEELDVISRGFEGSACAKEQVIEEKAPEKIEEVEQKLAEVVEVAVESVESKVEQVPEEPVEKVVEEIIEKEVEKGAEEPVELSTIGEILEEIEEERAKSEPAGKEEASRKATYEESVDLKSLAQEIGTAKPTSAPAELVSAEGIVPSIAASLTKVPGPKVVYSDGKNEYAVSIDAKVTIIGSSDDADVVLKFPGVASKHAEITKKGNRFILRDLGSREGVYIGGQRIKGKIELNHLDIIKVGSVELRVLLED